MQWWINGNKIDKLSGFFSSGKYEEEGFLSAFLVSDIIDKLKGGISGDTSETKPTI